MKYIISTVFSILISFSAYTQCAGDITLTHSATENIISLNSVACPADNDSYFRVFDITNFGIANDFEISSVDFGIEATAGLTVTMNLYTLSGPLMLANLTPIHSQPVIVDPQTLTVINVPLSSPVIVAPDDMLVVEIFAPDQSMGVSFFIGSNPDGQTAPSYLLSVVCGASEPTDIATLGFPNMHIVMNVLGCEIVPDIEIVPTLGEWAIICLAMVMLIVGTVAVLQKEAVVA